MSEEWKDRIKRAYQNYLDRELKKMAGPTRKNDKPEKDVERDCLQWMRAQGWSVQIFEAKATYDPNRRVYRQQAMKDGTLDCMGNMPDGHAVVVEFKAPGRLSTLREKQRRVLERKIESGVFACVVDSLGRLRAIYSQWRAIRDLGDFSGAKAFLMESLPKARKKSESEDWGLF